MICFFNLFSLIKIIKELAITKDAPSKVKIFGISLQMKYPKTIAKTTETIATIESAIKNLMPIELSCIPRLARGTCRNSIKLPTKDANLCEALFPKDKQSKAYVLGTKNRVIGIPDFMVGSDWELVLVQTGDDELGV